MIDRDETSNIVKLIDSTRGKFMADRYQSGSSV